MEGAVSIIQTTFRRRGLPVSFVGSVGGANNANVSWTASLPSGLLQGDLVVVAATVATSSSSLRAITITSGYTTLAQRLVYNSNGLGTYLVIATKFMGVTPDTTVAIGSNAGSEFTVVSCSAYRNVSQAVLQDVARVDEDDTASAVLSTGVITPVTPGAMAVYVGSHSSNYTSGSVGLMSSGGYFDVTERQLDFDVPKISGLYVGRSSPWVSGAIGASAINGEYLLGTEQSRAQTTFVLRPA